MSNEQEANDSGKGADRGQPEYVMVHGEFGYYRVSRQTAAWIVAQLDRRFRPRWITFEDLFNALVRVRTKDVECLYDSSPSIRARRRVFDRAMDREEDENPDWKDNS